MNRARYAAPMGADQIETVTRRDWTILLGLALVLRLISAWFETVVHPDEVYQYLEGAFRALHGYSVITWEYRDGMRSDLFPALLSVPMRIGEWIAADGRLPILLPRVMMALLSLGIVAAGGWMGARISRLHFWTGGLVAAGWTDLVGFAPHPLTEQMAALLAVPAVALLAKPGRRAGELAAIGFALGLAILFRPHVAPAIGLAVLGYLWGTRFAGIGPLVAGGLGALMAGAASDIAGGTYPFEWLVHNFTRNIVDNVAARYGVSGPFQYLIDLWGAWSAWGLPILILAAIGARRYPLLAVLAIANIVVHSCIGHKEYRFIILSVTAIALLAGIGTADFIGWWVRRTGRGAAASARFGMALWLVAAISVIPAYHALGTRIVTPFAARAIDNFRGRPDLCGMALIGYPFDAIYGYARLRRHVPIFIGDEGPVDPALFNAAIIRKDHVGQLPISFRATACSADGKQCSYERAGGCSGESSRFEINRYLHDRGM